MNKQQAIATLEIVADSFRLQNRETAARQATEALAALNDTYRGFSNRETWEAVEWVRNHPIASGTIQVLEPEAFGEIVQEQMADEAIPAIGSLWRVNWDEVAAALATEGDK